MALAAVFLFPRGTSIKVKFGLSCLIGSFLLVVEQGKSVVGELKWKVRCDPIYTPLLATSSPPTTHAHGHHYHHVFLPTTTTAAAATAATRRCRRFGGHSSSTSQPRRER